MIMMNNENGFSGGDLKEKALSAIITKTNTDWEAVYDVDSLLVYVFGRCDDVGVDLFDVVYLFLIESEDL